MHAELLLLAGLGLGFANTLASSGSAISLPILLGLGLAPELANGTNRVAVLVGAIAATASFARAERIRWPIVTPLMIVAAVGALLGVWISEVISPMRMQFAILAAECVALALMVIRPARWVNATGDNPRVGPLQLGLVFLIGIWTGFIILDGGTYLPILLVLSVGFSVLGATAKAVMSVGALTGGLIAARVAMIPGVARWVYRLIVLILVGELGQLVLGGLRM